MIARANHAYETGMSQAGLTLVEMLVVLTIIGITAGAATLSLGGAHRADGAVEARRLAARLQLAADDALLTDRELALQLAPDGYRIVERADAGAPWQPTRLAGLADQHGLPPGGMTLTATPAATLLPLGQSNAGDAVLTLRQGPRAWQVTFDGTKARLAPAVTVP